jgi:hypothetical protein
VTVRPVAADLARVGYTGNPPIFPLIHNGSSSDVLIVQLSPMRREEGG